MEQFAFSVTQISLLFTVYVEQQTAITKCLCKKCAELKCVLYKMQYKIVSTWLYLVSVVLLVIALWLLFKSRLVGKGAFAY